MLNRLLVLIVCVTSLTPSWADEMSERQNAADWQGLMQGSDDDLPARVAELAKRFEVTTFQDGYPGKDVYLEGHRFLCQYAVHVPSEIKIPGPRDRLLTDYLIPSANDDLQKIRTALRYPATECSEAFRALGDKR